MRNFASISLIVVLFCTTASAQLRRPVNRGDSEEGIYSRTIIHPDETRTVSKQDLNNKIREKQTLDKHGTLLMKSIFQLSTSGKPLNGLVYDGRGQLLYRSEFIYDRANEVQEERVFSANGQPVRRLIYKKDRFGQSKPFALSFDDASAASKAGRRSADTLVCLIINGTWRGEELACGRSDSLGS